jgi:hypothetical protein
MSLYRVDEQLWSARTVTLGEFTKTLHLAMLNNFDPKCLNMTDLNDFLQVVDQLGNRAEHVAVLTTMQIDPTPAECNTDIGLATFSMIRDLIVHLHENETDISKSVLVFLPTYRALEQQWSLLTATGLSFHLYALHSSIDMEHSLKAMEVACNFNRKVCHLDFGFTAILIFVSILASILV